MTPVVLTGRAPHARDEIAFGPGTMHDLKLHIGEHVRVGATSRSAVTIVGNRAAARVLAHRLRPERVDDRRRARARSAPAGQARLQRRSRTTCSCGGSRARTSRAAQHRLATLHPATATYVHARRRTADRGREPRRPAVAAPRARRLLRAARVGDGRARARHDGAAPATHELAVLRSIGFTRRQSRIAIAWQATLHRGRGPDRRRAARHRRRPARVAVARPQLPGRLRAAARAPRGAPRRTRRDRARQPARGLARPLGRADPARRGAPHGVAATVSRRARPGWPRSRRA